MTNFISTYSLDTTKINNLIDFECKRSDEWEELICENEGNFIRENEFMVFEVDGFDLVITYDLSVSGRVEYNRGDYWTSSYSDCEINYENIDVTEVTLDNYNIELTKELKKLFSEVIKKNL
jgi:hypothetical protein